MCRSRLKMQVDEELVVLPWRRHLRDVPCIRSVFNVSFSRRFMVGYSTQIWSIYVHPRAAISTASPPSGNSWIPALV